MRITISGTHSIGKSTLISALKQDPQFSDYTFIDGPTRLAKSAGIPINEDGVDATQLWCLSYDLMKLFTTSGNIISDRCLLDTFVYSKYLYLHQKISESTMQSISLLWEQYKSSYDIIIMPSHFEVPLEDDNERSINREFRDSIYLLFLQEINNNIGVFPTYVVGGTVEQRVETIKSILK